MDRSSKSLFNPPANNGSKFFLDAESSDEESEEMEIEEANRPEVMTQPLPS